MLHLSPLHQADPLVAEADAEQRLLATADRFGADAEVVFDIRPSRAWGDDDVVELQPRQLLPARLVVAGDDRFSAVHLCQQLEEVVGEGVVVVDQQRLHQAGRIGKISRPWPIDGSPTARAASSRRCSWSTANPSRWRHISSAWREASKRSTRRSCLSKPRRSCDAWGPTSTLVASASPSRLLKMASCSTCLPGGSSRRPSSRSAGSTSAPT